MTPMGRVTLATRIYAPEPAAAAFRLRALATALVNEGLSVTVLTSRAPLRAGERGEHSPGVDVRRFPVLRDRTGSVRGYVPYLSFDIPLFFRMLVAPRPDVVVVEPPPTTGLAVRLACAIRRVPYVYYAADIWSDASAALAPRFVVRALRALESWVMRGAASVIAVTDGVAERAKELGARGVRLVRNGIDTAVFTPAGSTHPNAPTAPYVVYAGTMSQWQGAEVFVRAMALVREKVPDAVLVYLGQGASWQTIEREARKLPDGGRCVRMLPPVPPAEASAWLRGARAALVSMRPGAGYDMAFPTKILAGLASGAPVLYAGSGVARTVVAQQGLGRTADWDDESVAAEMVTMLEKALDGEERRQLARWVDANASWTARASEAAKIIRGALPEGAR